MSVAAATRRAALIGRVRDYFKDQKALEVDTPALSHFATVDPNIESLVVRDSTVSAGPLYLQTSPEFAMKRLLAAGYPDIYSIAQVFRDGESGSMHQPEFTMLEWYRLDYDLEDIVSDTVGLISSAMTRRLATEVNCLDYRQAFLDSTALDPLTANPEELAKYTGADRALKLSIGDNRDDWLDLVLSTEIVPSFPDDRLTVLQHYPASQAALARLCPENPMVADRFEVFCGTFELANGYVELTDAEEQSYRFENEQRLRRTRNQPERPADLRLLAALEDGLPQCAGVALGIERLQLVDDETDNIANVTSFAFENNAFNRL